VSFFEDLGDRRDLEKNIESVRNRRDFIKAVRSSQPGAAGTHTFSECSNIPLIVAEHLPASVEASDGRGWMAGRRLVQSGGHGRPTKRTILAVCQVSLPDYDTGG